MPSHLLKGRSLVALPDHAAINEFMNINKRHKLLSQMHYDFWVVWYREYLQYMNQRSKRNKYQPNNEVGSMVIIKSENSPLLRWPIGRETVVSSNYHPVVCGFIQSWANTLLSTGV